ncbi:MAG: ABC transporter substrate-binding protein [Aeromicrobium sp.]
MSVPSPLRRRRLVVVPVAAALLLSACGGGSDGGSSDGPPQTGGDITIGLNSALACLDPHQNSSNTTIFVTRSIADSLTDQDPETGELEPWLATQWEANADATKYTFTLRDDVTFSDGTPFTADSVKANFDAIKALTPAKAPLANNYLSGYSGSTVIDPTTVEVDFETPNVQFLQGTSTITLGQFAESTTSATADERCQGALVGTGPFTVKDYQPEQATVLAKRTGYGWGSPLRQHEGAAYLDTATFKVIPESGVRTGQLRSGELDVDTIPLTEDVTAFESDPGFKVIGRPYPGLGVTLVPNLQRPLLQDVKVRQALVEGIDREELVAGVLTKYDKVPESPLTSVTPLVEPIPGVTFDPDHAKQLLDEAGWTEGSDGIREKDGQKLTLTAVYHFSRQSTPAMELVQQQLRAIGIDLEILLPSPADLAKYQTSGDYDLWFTPFHRAEPDAIRSTLSFYAGNTGKAPEARPVDELLTQQSQETDPAKRQQEITDAATQLVDEGYVVPLYELAGLFVTTERVNDLVFEASSRLNLYDVWVDQA